MKQIKNFILDILFPKFCIICSKEGSYLCYDCFSMIDILENPQRDIKTLDGLYCAVSYDNFVVKKLINQFKYGPCIKELSSPLFFLILTHFTNLNELPVFKDFVLISVPLHKKKIKQRGFNQAEEIGKHLSKSSEIPILNNVLFKIKQTPAQVELKKEQRKENIKGAFSIQNPELIKEKKILLIDDIFTTGSTLKECAKVLKQSGAKEIWGVVIARG